MNKKRVFYTELSYLFGMIILAFAVAFTEKSDFGVSMVVAPSYILHLKISQFLPWFTFGVAEYVFQGFLIILTVIIVRGFKKSYLFSFVTAVINGIMLDIAMEIIAPLPEDIFLLRILYYILGTLFCAFAISLFFHTYISPKAYELIIKEITEKFGFKISTVKTIYDYISTVLAVAMSFLFFGFGVFKGVSYGTIISATVSGFLIGIFTKLLEKHFLFKNKFDLEKYFK